MGNSVREIRKKAPLSPLPTGPAGSRPEKITARFHEAKRCRCCGNPNLVPVLDLGEQYLSGVFPSLSSPPVGVGPVQLVKCMGSDPAEFCGLVQMRHSFAPEAMYGATYGYRSGLNRSMVEHLHRKADALQQRVSLGPRDLVLDIGSNDGTSLARYPSNGPTLVGIDPSAKKFAKYYRQDIELIVDFFSADVFRRHFGNRKAKVITSIAMFYDLERPQAFVDDVASILADDGVWHLEQSYLPSMLKVNSYDTACHEHLEYYTLRQIDWMARRAGLRVIDVELNGTNGGSFSVTIAKENSVLPTNSAVVRMSTQEAGLGLDTLKPFEEFWARVLKSREDLLAFFARVKREGKTIVGYGASTKGNVLLQFCGITSDMLPCIAEVNEDKFGCFTPGTLIPIIPEQQARDMKPDYFLVLPWHFRAAVVEREKEFTRCGGRLVFPLPSLEIVG